MPIDIIKGIEEFVNRAPSNAVADRVSKYVTKLGSRGLVGEERVLERSAPEVNSGAAEDAPDKWNRVQAFFSPVGYRPLFEQELLFLMEDGLTYDGIMQMPVYLRKMLIDKKLKRNKPDEADDEADIPPALLEQFRASAQMRREASSPLPSRG
jgi:hypothetical protein